MAKMAKNFNSRYPVVRINLSLEDIYQLRWLPIVLYERLRERDRLLTEREGYGLEADEPEPDPAGDGGEHDGEQDLLHPALHPVDDPRDDEGGDAVGDDGADADVTDDPVDVETHCLDLISGKNTLMSGKMSMI